MSDCCCCSWLSIGALIIGIYLFSKFIFRFLLGPWHQKPLNLKDRTVLITGASSGIGRSLAVECYKKGAKVIVTARNVDKLAELCAELEASEVKNPNNPAFRHLDIAKLQDEITALHHINDLKALAIDGKTIDVLINNAGMSLYGSITETSMKLLRQVMEVNFFGQVLLTRMLYDSIPEDGAIVVNGSMQGKVALPFRCAYASSKHAIHAYFDSLRNENRPTLQVLAVFAGYVNSGFGARALNSDGHPIGVNDPNQAEGMTPDYVAGEIVEALISRKTELFVVQRKLRLAHFLRYFAPDILFSILHKRGQSDTHGKKKIN